MARQPSTVWETKVDFGRVERAQNRRRADTLRALRKILFAQQKRTLAWVDENLARKKLKTAVKRYELPLQARYRSELRKRLTAAALRGVDDVAGELGEKAPKLKTADLTRIRARADALFDDHKATLEGRLKRAWSDAMFGNVSAKQLEYETRRVFAEFAGWEPPTAPGG